MSATQDTMVAAVAAMEQAVQALSAAYEQYASATRDASREAARVDDLTNALGTHRIVDALVGRLRALGLEVDRATAGGRVGAEWVRSVTTDIQRLVR